MESQVVKDKCALWFQESVSAVTMQRRFCRVFGIEPTIKISIYKGYTFFDQIRRICKEKCPWRRPVIEEQAHQVRAVSVHSPRILCDNYTRRNISLSYVTEKGEERRMERATGE
jgi:hypothetical protein